MYRFVFVLVTSCALVAWSGCGGSNSKSDQKPSTPVAETNLNPVLFRTLENAPILTVGLKRQNGADISSIDVRLAWAFDYYNESIPQTRSATTSSSGTASVALPAGSYPVTADLSSITSDAVANLVTSVTVSSDTAVVYQTSQQNWTVTSAKQFTTLYVDVYALDSSGQVDWGTTDAPRNPHVLRATFDRTTPVTSANFTLELFKGSYKVLVRAKPAGTDVIHPYLSGVITAAGGGATESQTINLPAGGNIVSVTVKDGTQPVAQNAYSLWVFDRSTELTIDVGYTNSSGVVTIPVGTFVGVVAYLNDEATKTVVAARSYVASPNMTDTLTRWLVSGSVKPPAGAVLPSQATPALVLATPQLGTGSAFFDTSLIETSSTALSTDGLGTFSIKLFDGFWVLTASNVATFPDATKASVTVSGAPQTGVQIAVKPGGVITGRVQDEANNDLQNVVIDIWDSTTHAPVTGTKTAANGTYALQVPYGTYDLTAAGALSPALVVSETTATVTKNLRRFQLSGRLKDALGAGVAGTITWPGDTKTADNLGVFQIDVLEGLNYFVFTPPADKPSVGFEVAPLVLINTDTKVTDK